MSELANKAVFLSYASQDAEEARRICDALRAAGVEVWFDQSELRGGDAWDAKIRKQIRECALFVPVISANTQARLEGYFRVEWKLAAQRTYAMAEEKAFLVPVVIDQTHEADARVPAEFREVQWTRLADERAIAAFCARVKVLLIGTPASSLSTTSRASEKPALAGTPRRRRRRQWPALATAGLVTGIALGVWRPWQKTAEAAPGGTSTLAEAGTFPRDPELRRAWRLIMDLNFTTEDLALAEDIVKPALAARPADPEPAIVYSWLGLLAMTRGTDQTDERYAATARYAERAAQLGPENPWALAGLARYLVLRRADFPRAEQLARRAVELNPREPRLYGVLVGVLSQTQTNPEAGLQTAENAVRLFPNDALTAFNLQGIYRAMGREEEAERLLNRTLELAPMATALSVKIAGAFRRGDLATMKEMLGRMPEAFRASDRVIFWRYVYAYVSGQPAEGLAALQAFPGGWIRDSNYTGPKAFLAGDLLLLEQKPDLAHVQFEAALAALRQELARNPADAKLRTDEVWTLWRLGRLEEAQARASVLDAEGAKSFNIWFGAMRAYLLLGQRERALPLLKVQANSPRRRSEWRRIFEIDPRLAPWREDAEIKALLAGPERPENPITGVPDSSATVPVKVDPKSIAVLAFTNRSDDRAADFFSDGISEELLNVLGQVPGLRVAGWQSSLKLKGKSLDARELGEMLGVAHVVDGTVQKIGGRVRITARLTRAQSNEQIWGESYEEDLTDIFALQEKIARGIAQKLQLKLGTSARAAKSVNPEAHGLLLEGRHLWNQRTTSDLKLAEQKMARAVSIDPQFAAAHAGVADAAVIDALYALADGAPDVGPTLARGRAAATQARSLDPSLPEPLAALAYASAIEGKFADADRNILEAIALNPSYATAHQWRGVYLACQGKLEAALAEFELSVRLDPLSWVHQWVYGEHLIFAGRSREGVEVLTRSDALRGAAFWPLVAQRGVTQLTHGEAQTAIAAAIQIRQSGPAAPATTRWWADGYAVYILRRTGRTAEAEAYAREARARFPTQSYQHGVVLAALGRLDEAVPYLIRTPQVARRVLYWSDVFDPYRDQPAFIELMAKMGSAAEYATARETRARLIKAQEPAKK